MLDCSRIDTFAIQPFALNRPYIVELVQPIIFVVDTFNVDVDCAIGDGFSQVEVLILQDSLLEQEKIAGVVTAKSQLIVAIQYIKNSAGTRCWFIHVVSSLAGAADSFKRHADTVNSAVVRYNGQEAWHKIQSIFVCTNTQYILVVAGTSKLLAINHGSIGDIGKLFEPVGIGRVIPVYSDIG